ncbi:MAG: hypothetical protein KC996_07370 [Phycisphaerales bacterium]|nr:hypothetical protein [Phycisphaerales bacterium]
MRTPTTHVISRLVCPLGCGLVVASMVAAQGGCGERLRRDKSTKQATETPEVNSGLNRIANNDTPVITSDQPVDDFSDTRQKVLESASMLESYFSHAENEIEAKKQTLVHRIEPVDLPEPKVVDVSSATKDDGSGVRVSLADAVANQTEAAPAAVDESHDEAAEPLENKGETPVRVVSAEGDAGGFVLPRDPELRKEELVDELVNVLTELAQSADDPGSSAVALAGLETLRPDTLKSLTEQGLLSDAERASLDAVRSMLRSIVGDGSGGGTIASPAAVSEMLARVQRDLNAQAGLKINDAKLCISVSGYGQYEQFPSNTFVAGRTHRAIVYVEMDRFTQKEMAGPDGEVRYEVQLSQRLELYHIADDLNTWNRKAETDTTISRNRLRDYYLINQITLPPNLGIGKYNLKVVMRDLIANQVVEAIIPIEIVAG